MRGNAEHPLHRAKPSTNPRHAQGCLAMAPVYVFHKRPQYFTITYGICAHLWPPCNNRLHATEWWNMGLELLKAVSGGHQPADLLAHPDAPFARISVVPPAPHPPIQDLLHPPPTPRP